MRISTALLVACSALGAAGASAASVPQSGDLACLDAPVQAVSCVEPGLYARAADMAELAASPSPKAEAARRELSALYAKGSCAPNKAVASATGGKVSVLRRSHRARSKTDDAVVRQLEDEFLASTHLASYKAPPKFKGVEFYTSSAFVRVCGK